MKIEINTLYNYIQDWKYPMRQKRELQDLLVYKKNIVDIRNSVYNKKSCRISYVKKSSKEVKNYQIAIKSYYIKRDTKQILVFAKDLNENKQKTFLLNNILNVIQIDKNNNEKQVNIN